MCTQSSRFQIHPNQILRWDKSHLYIFSHIVHVIEQIIYYIIMNKYSYIISYYYHKYLQTDVVATISEAVLATVAQNVRSSSTPPRSTCGAVATWSARRHCGVADEAGER